MAVYESATTNRYTLRLEVTETGTSVENNTSTLSWKLSIVSGSTYFSEIRIGAKVVIDGTTVLNRAYSSSAYYSLARNSSVQIAAGTMTVAHGANGTKTIAAGAITAQNTTQTGTICPNMSLASGTALTLTPIPRRSSVAITGSSTNLGTSRTITITPPATPTSFTHTVTWTFGSASGTIATKTASLSLNWTPAKSLASQISSGLTQANGTITCATYNGSTLVGTSTATFTGKIPASEVSSSAANTKMGYVRTIAIDRAAANLTHKITYAFGSASGTIASSAGTSVDWTVPTALASQVPTGYAQYAGTITCETFNGTVSCGTSTANFLAKIPASAVTAPASITIGTNATITITRAASNLTHKLTYSFGSLSGASIASGVGTSYTWATPGTMVRQVPSGAVQAAGTVTCETFNGTVSCGTTTAAFIGKIPADALSVNGTTVTLGSNKTFTTTQTDAGATNIKHALTYTCGSTTGTIKNPSGTSETWTVPKSLASQAAANASTVTIMVTLSTYNGAALVGSKTVALTGSIPASTIGAHTFTIGTAGTVTISRAAPTLSHLVTFDFGSLTNQTAVAKTDTAAPTWTPAMTLCGQLPSATSGTGTIKVTTYNGTTQIGSVQTATLTLKVPLSVVPTSLSISTVIQNTNATINGWGIAVAGYSTVKSTVSAAPAYSAAISTRKVTFGGQSGNATLSGGNYIWTSSKLSESGSITPKLDVTDARGRTATQNGAAITVWAYAVPKVTQVSAYRSNSSGTKDRQGAYATVKLTGSVTSLGSRNTATIRARYRAATSSIWSAYTNLNNGEAKIINWGLSYQSGYVVELSITDTVGNTSTKTIAIPADQVTLNLKKGGLGVGVGQYALNDRRLELAPEWDVTGRVYGLGNLPAIASGEDINSYHTPGRYAVSSNAIAASLANCPSTYGGVLTIYASNGSIAADPDAAPWQYIIQEYRTYTSTEIWHRYATVGGTAGNWTYYPWYRIYPEPNALAIGLTYTTNSVITQANFASGVRLLKSGIHCILSFDVAPSAATATSPVVIGSIPEGSRPKADLIQTGIQQDAVFSPISVYLYAGSGSIYFYKATASTGRIRLSIPYFTDV